MYKVIGGDQQEYGPVTADELRHWIADGRLSAQSQARPEPGGEWRTLREFPEFEEALQAQARMYPGAATAATEPSLASPGAAGETRARTVRVGSCLSRSARLLGRNFGVLVGASAMAWLITYV